MNIYKKALRICRLVTALSLFAVSILLPLGNTAMAAELDESAITSTAAVLIDGKTGNIIWAKAPDEKIYPASTTKTMTALLLLEKYGNQLDEKVTVGEEVNRFGSGNSLMHLTQNEQVTYRDLLYGMMMVSGNDAANATGVAVSGDLETFYSKMNEKAKQLGMNNTNFINAHGLANDTNHYSTASDMAKVAFAAMQNETFRECVATKEYIWKATNMNDSDRTLANTNKLLNTDEDRPQDEQFRYQYAIGVKTGTTEGGEVGLNGCLIAAAQKDGRELIAVIMGDKSTSIDDKPNCYRRWQEAVDLFQYGFAASSADITGLVNATEISEVLPGETAATALQPKLTDGKATYTGDQQVIDALESIDALEYTVSLTQGIKAPYQAGQEVGRVEYTVDGKPVFSAPVTVQNATGSTAQPQSSAQAAQADPTKNRTFMIVCLVIALALLVFLFVRVMTAPRRRRRRRRTRRRY